MEAIRSRDNGHIKQYVGLAAAKKQRDATGLFAIEGARLCADAAESGVAIESLLLTGTARTRYPELERVSAKAARTLLIDEKLAGRISDTKTPQGVFAVCRKLDNGESAVTMERSGKYLMLCGLQDPGNLGTILRTAQAFGVDGVFACGCPDLYAPKVLRAAMGGLFRLPVAVIGDSAVVLEQLRKAGLSTYAAALTEGAATVGKTNFFNGCCVLIGNEGNGLPLELVERCDGSVMIPMAQGANSLNAATAAAILLWEMTKDRLEAAHQDHRH